MRSLLTIGLLVAALFGGTLASAMSDSTSPATDSPIPLPSTVDGFLIIEASDGNVDADGMFENNYGTLTVGKREFAIEVSRAVLKPVELPPKGARVRATLGSKTDEFGFSLYIVTALRRL